MPEEVTKQFAFHNFTTPVTGTPREVIDNDTTPRDNIFLNVLGVKKCKSGGASMMMKTGMEVYQDYTVFNYGLPRPQKDLKSQDITMISRPWNQLAQQFFSQVTVKRVLRRKPPPYALIIDNLEKSLVTTVYKAR